MEGQFCSGYYIYHVKKDTSFFSEKNFFFV